MCRNKIVRMPKPLLTAGLLSRILPPAVQRQFDRQKKHAEDEHAHVQIKPPAASGADLAQAPAIVHEVLRSPGQPLDERARAFMEPRFGWDFSSVRVHADSTAIHSARAVRARAYTVGHDIVFGAGQYQPGTLQGHRLLAHELTHVQQQSIEQTAKGVQRKPDKDDWSLVESTGEPRFVFWAKHHRKSPATYGEFLALLEIQAARGNEGGTGGI